VEVRKDGSENPLEQYVWSPRYMHSPVLRWRDGNTDGTLTIAFSPVRMLSSGRPLVDISGRVRPQGRAA